MLNKVYHFIWGGIPQRLRRALANGWAIFVDVLVGLANLWVFLLCGSVIWRGVVYYKKRMKLVETAAK
jgi:hypothetical protein